jgi:hypothetical protein
MLTIVNLNDVESAVHCTLGRGYERCLEVLNVL